jgi:uncharacterized membrane protein
MMGADKRDTPLLQALRYPFQEKGQFSRLLTLALVQLLPVAGQLILLGYGQEVARAVYAGKMGLPPIRWIRALADGLRVVAAGLLYVVPILAVVPMIITIGMAPATADGGPGAGLGRLVLTVGLTAGVTLAAGRLRVQSRNARYVMAGVVAAVPTITVVAMFASGGNTTQTPAANTGGLNAIGILLLAALSLFILFVLTGLSVGAVRYAVEGKGLFNPTDNARLMLNRPALTGKLMLSILALALITILTTVVGLVLFILPGLLAFAICMIAYWYLLTGFVTAPR